MSFEAHRIRLIMELRQQGITDTKVLSAIERVPREEFVPPAFQYQAYENTALPIGEGQTISQPTVVAFMTQELEIADGTKILEIGTGSGYQAAVLAKLCRRVYTIERNRDLYVEVARKFSRLRLHNIVPRCADGTKGWPEQAPFDRILVTAAATAVPEALLAQLAPGGMLLLPLGPTPVEQHIVRLRKTTTGMVEEVLWPVRFVPLVPDQDTPPRPRADSIPH